MLRRLAATWGNADYGRLGHGKVLSRTRPRVIAELCGIDVKAVEAGGAHTAVLADDGTLYTFGLNDHGQLGHSQEDPYCQVPREVLLPEPIVSVACGYYHTLAVSDTGRIWGFGKNSAGQLGLGGRSSSAVPWAAAVKALEGEQIAEVCAGAEHSLARSASGELYSWGCSKNGKLGHGKESIFSMWGKHDWAPRLIRPLRGVKISSLAAGLTSSGAVDDSGNVYTFGYGRFWQLGLGHDNDQPVPEIVPDLGGVRQLAMGALHTVAVKQGGAVMVWGGNEHGCLGTGQSGRALRSPTMLPKVDATHAACGWKHTCAVTPNGELLSWGWGGAVGESFGGGQQEEEEESLGGGQLGLGNDFDMWAPHAVMAAELGGGMKEQASSRARTAGTQTSGSSQSRVALTTQRELLRYPLADRSVAFRASGQHLRALA
eukprot:CAMPEP_0117652148 /NCGR_PEP_ID=MMETSP0804-20121206/2473_1 /TAXON_ID=1074897 /ORGANISM="Tetraselmis astigmatica, Strain CCMP880" /LENGTH=429 /DNA_ID=CAMNT_0005458177 /DNA_START=95 /DNA_END=1385 /DNA_ORIENTATION=-